MEEKKPTLETKYFKYKLTPTMIAIAVAVLVLCAAGIGVSAYRIYKSVGSWEFADALKSPLLILICLFCIAIVIAILVKSQYVVTDKYYITQYGFIKSKFFIKDITSMELNTDTHKLTVYCGEQYSVLSLSPEWSEAFVRALLDVKPSITYTFTLADKEPDKKKKKKK